MRWKYVAVGSALVGAGAAAYLVYVTRTVSLSDEEGDRRAAVLRHRIVRAAAAGRRTAGYCAYFVDLSPEQQAEVIARTEEQG